MTGVLDRYKKKMCGCPAMRDGKLARLKGRRDRLKVPENAVSFLKTAYNKTSKETAFSAPLCDLCGLELLLAFSHALPGKAPFSSS